ncbi:UBP-type domain-containing protein, partial [Haematococcus lacustris]
FIHDCPLHPATYHCARLAAGSAVEVALAVARGQARSGAAIIRPPGHHAESGLALGFCLFNNAAVAARAAQREAGVQRVLIVDWDIHHGNGTQPLAAL